jgi:23S rRNA (guanine2445-N2)-methyltransferase / 23S rRNA (guanine2069-N7)-methyltransferase
MNASTSFFATCPKGLETLLSDELTELGAQETRITAAGAYFAGSLEIAYRVCLWSRLANKVLLPLASWDVDSGDALYEGASAIAWEQHLTAGGSFLVDFTGTNNAVRHTQYGAMRIKDAIVDQLRQTHGQRPNIDLRDPDLRINAHLTKNKLKLSLDLSGPSLHKRGYRTEQGVAPLKENLAAAILLRADWPTIAATGGSLLDPMCGSGTFLVEAAWMAADIAPGLLRSRFGFEKWLPHNEDLWRDMLTEARERKAAGLAKGLPEIRGYDENPRVLDAAQNNIERAGVDEWVRVSRKSVADFKKPTHTELQPGLMVCNPPYGERLGEKQALAELYRGLGQVAKAELPGWQLGVFTGNPQLGKELRLRPKRKYKFFNGPIASELLLFDLLSEDQAQLREDSADQAAEKGRAESLPEVLSQGAQMVANRLRKNRKRLSKWLQKEGITCYRVYDADMPEYSAAVDVYGSRLHIQEYTAPKTIDPEAAERRWQELLAAAMDVFDCGPDDVAVKKRQRNRGSEQYQKLGEPQESHFFPVNEGQTELLVNLRDYLDTGLFLDHRPLRRQIAALARGKSFLNLFCYTATATCHAALGGARESISVDMSRTYLDWARKNFSLNNISEQRHQLVQVDCLEWLKECRRGFDMIMLDPPSFSNSKRMEQVLDVQRDHVALIKRCVELLTPEGVLFFSTNLRSFKLDAEALSSFAVRDITRQTLDPDFAQNPKIHQCFEIKAK